MTPNPTQNVSASNDEAWQDFLDLIAWPSEGGKVPPDEDMPEPPVASSYVNVPPAQNPPTL